MKLKTLLFSAALLLSGFPVLAQQQDIKELYFDYTQIRVDDAKGTETIDKALELLKRSTELNDLQIANVNYHLGRIYETLGSAQKAIPHYEIVIKLVPGYYVPYRALGYINLKKCDSLGLKVSESAKSQNALSNEKAFKAYKTQVLKTIVYFEKSEACEADERTLSILKHLYKNIKDTSSLATLPARLETLGKDCVTLLED
ncbi:tetratricopeptide repeat protein [Pedobacter caeni]|uniref:Uncharacterized protein n=1 Tax=Pedobacter caeni TaxID=288992 RepID=A0A1M5JMT4_9SPHI|nr:hypothetical protein [Pedobacter caeni]SHG41902.1 hypothetical protein SAMN04488522_105435 [Pedobacter caeni]